MTSFRLRMWLALPAMILISSAVALVSQRFPAAPVSQPKDKNPNSFYLSATGEVFSLQYVYDPHAADAWMFRTAEGHLEGSIAASKK